MIIIATCPNCKQDNVYTDPSKESKGVFICGHCLSEFNVQGDLIRKSWGFEGKRGQIGGTKT